MVLDETVKTYDAVVVSLSEGAARNPDALCRCPGDPWAELARLKKAIELPGLEDLVGEFAADEIRLKLQSQ